MRFIKRFFENIRQRLCTHTYKPTRFQPLSDRPELWCECAKCGHGAYCSRTEKRF